MLHLSSNRPDSAAAVSQWFWDIQTVSSSWILFLSAWTFWRQNVDSRPEMSHLQTKLKELSNTCFKQSRSVCTSLLDHNLRSELILNFTSRCEINSSDSYRLETAHTHIDRCCLLWQIRPLLKQKVVKAVLEVCTNSISCSPQYTGIRSQPLVTGLLCSKDQNEVKSDVKCSQQHG